jgi:hypothetical protein
MKVRPVLVAGVLAAAVLLPAASVAADPEPIPCSPDACEPSPQGCDPQHTVNLGLQLYRADGQIDRLEQKVAARDALIVKLRRKLAHERGWR